MIFVNYLLYYRLRVICGQSRRQLTGQSQNGKFYKKTEGVIYITRTMVVVKCNNIIQTQGECLDENPDSITVEFVTFIFV